MKIAVMGAGALGGYFGGRLAAAGYDVALIARGAHLAAMQAQGLRIESPRGDLHLRDIMATDDPATIGPVDVVMFMVKNYDIDSSAAAIAPLLGAETMVVHFQNGVSAAEQLGAAVGHDRVVPGVARIPADIRAPGVIRHSAGLETLIFGERDGGPPTRRCRRFAEALERAGATVVLHERIQHELWAKFVMQASLSSLTALTRLDVGPLRDCPASRALFWASMQETATVGRAVLPDLDPGLADTAWEFVKGIPPNVHTSMLDDLQRGKRIEVKYLSGEVVRLGKLHGVATPIHEVLAAALAPFENGAPG